MIWWKEILPDGSDRNCFGGHLSNTFLVYKDRHVIADESIFTWKMHLTIIFVGWNMQMNLIGHGHFLSTFPWNWDASESLCTCLQLISYRRECKLKHTGCDLGFPFLQDPNDLGLSEHVCFHWTFPPLLQSFNSLWSVLGFQAPNLSWNVSKDVCYLHSSSEI